MTQKVERRRRIGIMGGTFDPIHNGHLVAGSEVADRFGLDLVVYVPTGQPWQKADKKVSPAEDRYLMTVIATASNPRFTVSRVDIDRGGDTYTIDTLQDLKKQYPDAQLYFITGADAINDLPDWHQPRELLASCHFIAARRQGTALDMAKLRGFFGSLCDAHIHELATPELEISSTQIRGRIREGRSIRYMVPESVETYIRKEGLYR